ncbi:MAG TPA: SDR family NAD(P)-dependent oxidoreductase [Streptosporangiaceae bacterium]|jgi:NAD(P)-dependent dehydrogenase (short-subunit alcohol dehydrogenase family)
MGRLSGKVAFITGGEGSIGMAGARRLAAEDAHVVLAGIDENGLRAGVDELGRDAASHVVTDVADAEQVAAAVRTVADRHGGIDIVFSNAGISGDIAPVTEYPDDVFDRVLAVHVRGSFLVCKHALPVMRAGGSLIITSSVVGLTSAPGIVAYATAKHALVGLMRTVAHEAAPRGIRVNTIHPGPVDNEFQHAIEMAATGASREEAAKAFEARIPLGRHADPDEVARAVLFLAGPDSTFITGSTVAVDGGMSI